MLDKNEIVMRLMVKVECVVILSSVFIVKFWFDRVVMVRVMISVIINVLVKMEMFNVNVRVILRIVVWLVVFLK